MSKSADPNPKQIRSVLVVDNDTELRMMYQELLGSQGYICQTAPNVGEALKFIMRHEVDVIIYDLMLSQIPSDTFYHAVQRVKQHLAGRFIFVTSYDNNPKIEAFIAKVEGIVLHKPITLGKLKATLNLLSQRIVSADKRASVAP